ncbi:16S rRNA (guanine(527)-N(7))-methyltransferase RsmG [Tabrizicola sp. DMG-N-6]|uniref:Ribosomal RNA small subunit methyltransferase G n=2 Tax=Szabonella alba TaxID=2804194 RepID=A0A8K0VAN0_9RHOB|nr:16S rRNA (guanine(527)-N(7))-methyltransferase RsmG [Szabonella alba]
MISRDAAPMLDHYLALLTKWNVAINLVSPATLKEARHRHFLDSAQIYHLSAAEGRSWVDLGSGAGFPGLVLAILRKAEGASGAVTLIEADRRKAVFLTTVIRELSLDAQVIVDRIERAAPQQADRICARALAALPVLCGFMERHADPSAVALFPKGRNYRNEVEEARQNWDFSMKLHESVTDPEGVILEIQDLLRKS